MYIDNRLKGSLLIAFGISLFLVVTSTFLLRLILAIFSLYIVAKGMRMRGYPPSMFIFRQWMGGNRFF